MSSVENSSPKYEHLVVEKHPSEDLVSLFDSQIRDLAKESKTQLKLKEISADCEEMSDSFQILPCGLNPSDVDRYKGFDLYVYGYNELCT